MPIEEIADISYQPGPMQISRDNTFRRTSVGINTRGRDVESVVTDIQQKLDAELELPVGYYITYGGEFENLQRAKSRLSIVVPIALFLIFILLYFALNSFSQSVMIYLAIPLAAIGGIFFLALRDMSFSISAGVGFIVLFGVAVTLASTFLGLRELSSRAEDSAAFQAKVLSRSLGARLSELPTEQHEEALLRAAQTCACTLLMVDGEKHAVRAAPKNAITRLDVSRLPLPLSLIHI